MKKPAGQPVRSSPELIALVTTLQAQALVASQAVSALCEREILCEYMGQRQGPARHKRYHQNPCELQIPPGKTRNCVAVSFRWTCVGAKDLEPVLTDQQNKDARRRGVTRPESLTGVAAVAACSVWCDRALEALQNTDAGFVCRNAPELQREFGQKVQCTYAK